MFSLSAASDAKTSDSAKPDRAVEKSPGAAFPSRRDKPSREEQPRQAWNYKMLCASELLRMRVCEAVDEMLTMDW